MGLAGPRKRTKISHDPNNTNWTRSTTGFGHKILTEQGWTPGTYLGAKDAPHAHLHSAANASFIRVALKDDNLGLGAKRGSGQVEGECTGLNAFEGLLGRLNGKAEADIEKEQQSRERLKQAIYMESKWGTMRFVKGGLLVGGDIQKLTEDEANRLLTSAEESGEADSGSLNETVKKSKNRTKEEKKAKKEEKRKRREMKAKRKLERRARKHAKRKTTTNKSLISIDQNSNSQSLSEREDNQTPAEEASSAESEQANASSATPTESFSVGRLAVRQRYIRQKKMAVLDSRALNEIFMIKA